MSLTGILAGGLLNLLGTQLSQNGGTANQSGSSPVQNEFQQLGQDLHAGNLSAARQDFAAIEQSVRQRTSQIIHHHHHFPTSGAPSGTADPVTQDFGMLAQALQAGNLAAAQAAFSQLQQALDQPFPSLDPNAGGTGSQPSPSSISFVV
jgi:hypothetical protein